MRAFELIVPLLTDDLELDVSPVHLLVDVGAVVLESFLEVLPALGLDVLRHRIERGVSQGLRRVVHAAARLPALGRQKALIMNGNHRDLAGFDAVFVDFGRHEV